MGAGRGSGQYVGILAVTVAMATLVAAPDALAAEGPGHGFPLRTTSIGRGLPTTPVAAWSEFCRRMPAECAVDEREPEVLVLDVPTWKTVVSVNLDVNDRIEPVSDQEHWGVPDRWDIPSDGKGDCEDYQLLKRHLLVEAGLPARPLRMTVVVDEVGEGHAVLTVRTDRGDFVLDNKRDAVLPWSATGYRFVKREGSGADGRWEMLGGPSVPVVTANR